MASLENLWVRPVLGSSTNCERLTKNLLSDIGQAGKDRPIIPVCAPYFLAGHSNRSFTP